MHVCSLTHIIIIENRNLRGTCLLSHHSYAIAPSWWEIIKDLLDKYVTKTFRMIILVQFLFNTILIYQWTFMKSASLHFSDRLPDPLGMHETIAPFVECCDRSKVFRMSSYKENPTFSILRYVKSNKARRNF